MWERIAKCLGKGSGSGRARCGINMSDLQGRVPSNQMKQFKIFIKKREEYNSRLQKFPAEMPKIDWDYYRQNVREDKVEWVNKFAEKYDKLDSMFANRHSLIDTSKYFCEVDEQTKEVEKEVNEFKKQSNERIAKLQQQIDTLTPMKPYTEMTMEEYCLARPDLAPDFINKPTFWPHTPEEQTPGPSEPDAHHERPKDPDGPKAKPKSEGDKPDPKKPTPQTPPAGAAPTDDKAPAPPAPQPKKELPKEEKSFEQDSMDVASKAIDLAMLLVDKAVVACQLIVQKIAEKRKGGTGKSAPAEKSAGPIAKQPTPVDEEDSFHSRETVSNICHKTIIRGEDTKEPDVKPHHMDLDNQGETLGDDSCEKLNRKEQICDRDEKTDEEESPCKQKPKCDEEKAAEVEEKKESKCKPDPKCEEEDKEKEVCKPDPKCEEVDKKGSAIGQKLDKGGDCRENFPTSSDPKATHDAGADAIMLIARVNEPVSTPTVKCQDAEPSEIAYESISKQQSEQQRFEEIKLMNESFDLAKRQIMDRQRESQMLENIVKEKKQALQVKFPLGGDDDSTAKTSRLAPVMQDLVVKKDVAKAVSKEDGGQPEQSSSGPLNIDSVPQHVLEMANSAANLLSDAEKTLKKAQAELGGNKQEVEFAYVLAAQKVAQALETAQMALDSARTQAKDSGMDKGTIALVEKNTMLAQVMVSRATAMKEEIAKLRSDLKLL